MSLNNPLRWICHKKPTNEQSKQLISILYILFFNGCLSKKSNKQIKKRRRNKFKLKTKSKENVVKCKVHYELIKDK